MTEKTISDKTMKPSEVRAFLGAARTKRFWHEDDEGVPYCWVQPGDLERLCLTALNEVPHA